jgi:hypothetical protein
MLIFVKCAGVNESIKCRVQMQVYAAKMCSRYYAGKR